MKTLSNDDESKKWQIKSLIGADGQSIRYGIYQSNPTQTASVAVFFLNGRTEYIEKYQYVASDLNLPKNWIFITLDHRGQGSSTCQQGHIDHFKYFALDASFIAEKVIGSLPYHVVAHSMGALIALWATMKQYLRPTTLHMLSPLLGIYHPFLSEKAFEMIAKLSCTLGMSKSYVVGHSPLFKDFSANALTSDMSRYEKIINTPYKISPITYGWLKAAIEAIQDVKNESELKKITCPIGLTLSENDRVVDSKKSLLWADKAKKIGLKIDSITLPGLHELLSEEPTVYQQTLKRIRKIMGL